MDHATAFGMLLQLQAAFMGSVPTPVIAPAAAAMVQPEQHVSDIALAEVTAAQARVFIEVQGASGKFSFAAAFDHEGSPWVKLRQGAWLAAYSAEALQGGVEADLPTGRHRIWLEQGTVKVKPTTHDVPPTAVALEVLYAALYEGAAKLKIPAVQYAILHETGDVMAPAVCLLRRNAEGRYFVGFNTLERLARTRWFVAVNGLMYGMRVEQARLVFVSAPVPPLAEAGAFLEIPARTF